MYPDRDKAEEILRVSDSREKKSEDLIKLTGV